jgi:3-deoxy-manno-octulosonate cytidylyltransferase (CMP-KDO synthetase)
MKIVAIIPARFDSSRFPGKPLAEIQGKTMIHRVYEQTKKAIDDVFVATDDQRIEAEVLNFGGKSIMTESSHKSGTDRLAEAIKIIESSYNQEFDIIINVQGDEPFIHPEQIKELIGCFHDESTEIATLIKTIALNEEIFNPNLPKVVVDKDDYALYFSRSPIPYIRNMDKGDWSEHFPYRKHLGMYGYRKEVLKKITLLPPSSLEIAESLEQNRWLENGYKIKTQLTEYENHPVDTPDDLKRILS